MPPKKEAKKEVIKLNNWIDSAKA